jgi:hypothetical protein
VVKELRRIRIASFTVRETLSQVNFFLVSKAIIDVLINVALQYNHKLSRTSELKQELAIV